jgi:tight adherence protein B
MMPLLVAALVFAAIMIVITGIWVQSLARQRAEERLRDVRLADLAETAIVRAPAGNWPSVIARLQRLAAQSGYAGAMRNLLLLIGIFALGGAVIGWFRTGKPFWGVVGALLLGVLPVAYIAFLRYRRMKRLEEQFPDALDMMARSLRAGHALGFAIRNVGEEMPAPMGLEFAKVAEEIRLGREPTEALSGLEGRAPTEDVAFFCTAIRIQRNSGGNLAEILDRLSEVIRERFKLLSRARVLSVQHRYTAIFVGLSPAAFSAIIELLHPGYFKPLLESPLAPYLIGGGIFLEVLGFFCIWRIATVEV